MSNTIRLNESAPINKWLTMSNQGTDCFFELLLWEKLPYEPEESIVIPWLDQFAEMIKEFTH